MAKRDSHQHPTDRIIAGLNRRDSDRATRRIVHGFLAADHHFNPKHQHVAVSPHPRRDAELTDLLILGPRDQLEPRDIFTRLRWGGQVVAVNTDGAALQKLATDLHGDHGFVLDTAVSTMRVGPLGLPLPRLSKRLHFVVARKVMLIPPGDTTDRFTFNVRLVRHRGQDTYGVVKQVPTYSAVVKRLKEKYPDADLPVLVDRARKLVDHIFPVFLTREAGMLKLLERDLPDEYKSRVPRAVSVEKDDTGLITKLHMNWLRVGGPQLTQLDFARQATDLLRILHDHVGVIHLDLRMDNFVITPDGVGFVDFGSAVRVGEDFSESPMLLTLFDEMMSTSQIQRTLGKMKESGRVTSSAITAAHKKVDRAVDLFYLAVQINRPNLNPELTPFIRWDTASEEARRISLLSDAILRPTDPARPRFITAADVLSGLNRIERKLTERNEGARITPKREAA